MFPGGLSSRNDVQFLPDPKALSFDVPRQWYPIWTTHFVVVVSGINMKRYNDIYWFGIVLFTIGDEWIMDN